MDCQDTLYQWFEKFREVAKIGKNTEINNSEQIKDTALDYFVYFIYALSKLEICRIYKFAWYKFINLYIFS